MSTRHQTLSDFLGQWAGTDAMRGKVRDTILALADATASISAFVASASLNGAAPEPAGMRPWLITSARNIVTKALKGAPVAAISCEKSNGPHPVNPGAELVVALDSMDGSSNIETNASVGGIFSIMTNSNGKGDAASFLQKGRDQLAAGFMMYGPQTLMVFTTGNGTHVATLDRESREFIITATDLHVEQTVREYAVNASNYRHWDDGTRAYIDDCLAGSEGPREENYTMRWVAALVAEAYRVLVRGAIFLYPRDSRKGYDNGRLWLVHEAFAIAMVIEQAGGKASNGVEDILDIKADDLARRTPLIFGPAEEVERIKRYIENPPGKASHSPLFGQRGLFRK